jgi:hypothetical protein
MAARGKCRLIRQLRKQGIIEHMPIPCSVAQKRQHLKPSNPKRPFAKIPRSVKFRKLLPKNHRYLLCYFIRI